ncbi:hypothetical protein [Sinomicrobium sp. M5D2P9]
MADISLSDFVDYVSKAGTSKFSKVKEISRREDYHPALDFWKILRDAIIDLHVEEKNKKELDKILEELNDKKKINRYPELVEQYKSFLGRKKTEWFKPPSKEWKYEELRVRLNPELGLEINNKFYVIKLWFKAEKLSKNKADLIILLMNEKLKSKKYEDAIFAVLDIGNKKLYDNTKLTSSEFSLLEAEALSFMKIWKSLEFN